MVRLLHYLRSHTDNLVERLAAHRLPVLRLGHPARTLSSVVDHTLDARIYASDRGALLRDVRRDMDAALTRLSRCKTARDRRAIYTELRDLRKEYRQRETDVITELISNSRVIVCTLNGADSQHLWKERFDTVIIDEAAQALEAECWIALQRARCAILAGDHCQLPPTVLSQTTTITEAQRRAALAQPWTRESLAKYTLSITLFDRMLAQHGDDVKCMLRIQYRMHRDIMAFSSSYFYQNQLEADDSVANRLLTDDERVEETEDTSVPVVWIDSADCGWDEKLEEDQFSQMNASRYNEQEAQAVACYVARLIKAGLQPEDIAVITPYSAQVTRLQTMLREVWPTLEIGSGKCPTV
jgi:DNA polymerase alpha-associated DNA helicase A